MSTDLSANNIDNRQLSPIKQRWSSFFKSPLDWVLVAGLIGSIPLVFIEARSLWYLKHYQFFPLAWTAFVAILLLRGQVGTSTHRLRVLFGRVALLGSIGLAVMASLLYYPKVAMIAAIGFCFGWMLLRLNKNPWYECVAWILLLGVTVRLPVLLDQNLIHTLQSRSSSSASALLDLTRIPHLATGNVIEIRPGKLFVEEACSGVDSFYALGAVAIMLAIWQQRGLLVSLLTIASVPLWAWFGNVLRLYVLTFLYNTWDINLTEGWQHTALGLVIFALAFGGLLSMQEALTKLFGPLPGGDANTDWAHALYNTVVTWPDRMADLPEGVVVNADGTISAAPFRSTEAKVEPVGEPRPAGLGLVIPLIAVVICLGCGVITAAPKLFFPGHKSTRLLGFDKGAVVETFSADVLPAELEGMSQRNFAVEHREQSSMFGAHSAAWMYQDRGREVVISLDFAFGTFHPLEVCYVSIGSKVLGEIQQFPFGVGTETDYVSSVQLLDLFGEQSYLVYSEFTEEGVSAERMEVFAWNTFFNKGFFRKEIGPLYQLQMLVADAASLSDEDRKRYQETLLKAKQLLLPKIQQMISGGPVATPQQAAPSTVPSTNPESQEPAATGASAT